MSVEWRRAHAELLGTAEAPTDTHQSQLVRFLAEPIGAEERPRIVDRVRRLEQLVGRMSPRAATSMLVRLEDPTDPLGRLFRLELATWNRERLLRALEATARADERGTTPADRGVDPAPVRPPRPKPRPRPERPAPPEEHGPGEPEPKEPEPEEPDWWTFEDLWPDGRTLEDGRPEGRRPDDRKPDDRRPEEPRPPKERKPTARPRGRKDRDQEDGPSIWDWLTDRDFSIERSLRDAIDRAIGVGGVGVLGVAGIFTAKRLFDAVPQYVLSEALQLAFNHLANAPLEGGRANKSVGAAGERAANHIARWLVRQMGGSFVDLNELATDFPVADYGISDLLASVKTLHVLSARPGPAAASALHIAWEKKVGQSYARELYNIIRDDHSTWTRKREQAAQLILDNLDDLRQRGILVSELVGDPDIDDAIEFVRNRTILIVPADHVSTAQDQMGRMLRRLHDAGRHIPGIPEGLTGEPRALLISDIVGRIRPNAVAASDLRALLDVARRLPSIQKMLGTNEVWPPTWGKPPF